VRSGFPGLETQEKLSEHRAAVLKFMRNRQAVCVKEEKEIVGVMLFSRGHNSICCLAVAPAYRRRGKNMIILLSGRDCLARFSLTKQSKKAKS
ncbi:GNAT family N-acetyltransferase, partial [Salmonella enterica]|uniref:GNAT family N-acetyltransferase n=1 Tax=Salmonella enterica TaxID=28901 RepID=UPI0020C3C5A0